MKITIINEKNESTVDAQYQTTAEDAEKSQNIVTYGAKQSNSH